MNDESMGEWVFVLVAFWVAIWLAEKVGRYFLGIKHNDEDDCDD